MNVTEKRYQEEWNESNFDKELFIMKRSENGFHSTDEKSNRLYLKLTEK